VEVLKMAVGDIINILSAAGTTFIPAANVEIMIMSIMSWNNGTVKLSDGVTSSLVGYTGTTYNAVNNWSCKIGITNTTYLVTNLQTTASGIQIK
jgi:hypothetical protein